jgi:hypothetical protein
MMAEVRCRLRKGLVLTEAKAEPSAAQAEFECRPPDDAQRWLPGRLQEEGLNG